MLLYRSGYFVGKYISLEMIIERTKLTYYEKLEESSNLWLDSKNNYLPFVKYYLEVIFSAYKEFSLRVEHLHNRNLSKSDRVKMQFDNTLQKISKKAILEKCPDISMSTVELVLSELTKTGYIIKTGSGRSTKYIRNTNS